MGRRAFVIMPFDRGLDRLHGEAIKPAIEASGYVAERYDDAPRTGAVLDEIRNGIEHADLIVAVLTGKNPHVFFELGMTLARGKPCVLLAHSADDVPCFLQHLPCVLYRGSIGQARDGLAGLLAPATSGIRAA